MIQSKRSDKKKNVDKVTASLVKDPLQSEEQIAKDTWISQSAVNRAKKEVGKNGLKDDRIVSLTDKDFNLMQLYQAEKLRRMTEEKDKVNNTDINRWDETATKRYSLFKWDATDDKGWLKQATLTIDTIKEMTPDQINEKRRDLLNNE